jgi:hypothetical protein
MLGLPLLGDCLASGPKPTLMILKPSVPQTSPKFPGSVPFSMKDIGDQPLRKTARHNVLTYLVPSSLVSRLSQGHRGLPSGDCHPDGSITHLHREWHRPNSRYVYGWLSLPYADTPDRYLESPPQTSGYCWRNYINIIKPRFLQAPVPSKSRYSGQNFGASEFANSIRPFLVHVTRPETYRFSRRIFCTCILFTLRRRDLTGRTPRWVLPAWTSSESCALPRLERYSRYNLTPILKPRGSFGLRRRAGAGGLWMREHR